MDGRDFNVYHLLAFDLLRPAITTLLSKIAGENQGFIGGMNSTYTSLGNIIGPATGGILLNVNVNLPYIFAGLILAIGFGITVYWSKYITKQQRYISNAILILLTGFYLNPNQKAYVLFNKSLKLMGMGYRQREANFAR